MIKNSLWFAGNAAELGGAARLLMGYCLAELEELAANIVGGFWRSGARIDAFARF